MVTSIKINIYSRVWGAFFGAVKYLFIASILFVFVQRLDESFNLIDETSETQLFEPVAKFAPTIIPKLRFEIKQPAPMELDDITNEPEPLIEELDELEE